MDMRTGGMVLVFFALNVNGWAAFPWEDFDTMPVGSIAGQPGWESSYQLNPVMIDAGEVTTESPLTPPHAVELAKYVLANSRIVYTNLNMQPDAEEGPMVRAAVWIYRENRNQRIRIELGRGNDRLMLYEDATDRSLVFSNQFNGQFFDTGEQMATGRYSQIVFHYDTRTNDVLVQYDGETVIDSTHFPGPKLTNFTTFAVTRIGGSDTEGLVLVDNMHIECFPTNTVCWWRFDEYGAAYAEDVLGGYFAGEKFYAWPSNANPADARIYSGARDVPNYSACSGFVYTNMDIWRPIRLGSNWTFEAFLGKGFDGQSPQLIHLGENEGGEATTNALIAMTLSTDLVVRCTLRDSNSSDKDGEYFPFLCAVPRDQAWHHLAAVKSGAVLRCYLDYSLITTQAMAEASDGEYLLRINRSKVNLGKGIAAGANLAAKTTVADEMRLSAAALSPSDFLHASSPRILSVVPREDGNWNMFFEAPIHPNYAVEAISDLGGGAWTDTTLFVVTTGHISRVTISSFPTGIAFRLRRNMAAD